MCRLAIGGAAECTAGKWSSQHDGATHWLTFETRKISDVNFLNASFYLFRGQSDKHLFNDQSEANDSTASFVNFPIKWDDV